MIQEIVLIVVLLVIIAPLTGYTYFSMSSMVEMIASGALVAAFALMAVFFWRERAQDEREQLHRMMADRLGFLVGGGALTIIIVIQTLRHSLDIYAPIVLLLMVLAKIFGRIYSKVKN